MPAGIRGTFQGTAQAFQDSLKNEGFLVAFALFAVYIVLGILYESYIHPITILSTLPSAGVGAILALLLFHIELSVIALIGIILLIGIVKKNAIMMIDFALEAQRGEGKSPHDAIYEACVLRFRPIMMTTMAALLGGLPLALGQRHRLRDAPPARYRNRRRPDGEPDADALHDAGDLPVHGPRQRRMVETVALGHRPPEIRPRRIPRRRLSQDYCALSIGGPSAIPCGLTETGESTTDGGDRCHVAIAAGAVDIHTTASIGATLFSRHIDVSIGIDRDTGGPNETGVGATNGSNRLYIAVAACGIDRHARQRHSQYKFSCLNPELWRCGPSRRVLATSDVGDRRDFAAATGRIDRYAVNIESRSFVT